MLEHFVHAFVEVLGVFVRFVGERIARGASPDQFLRLGVEEIDDQGSDFVGFNCCGCVAKSAESAPAAASSEPVVEGVQSLFILSGLNGEDLDVTARRNFPPSLRRQSAIHGALDAVD